MKYLLVAHGPTPDLDHPVSGGALRAMAHERALRGAGHEVVVLRRAQDAPDGFASPGDLRRRAVAVRPDAILCVAPEEAGALRDLAPLCVDLYAPRLLEAAFEGLQSEAAGVALNAVHAADEVLFTNERQRWFWLGILGLAGWDLTGKCGRIVPLACMGWPQVSRATVKAAKGERPYFVAVGPRWPWQDPRAGIAEAVEACGKRAEVRVYGPASGVPGAREMGTVSRREWMTALAGALGLIDRYARNTEREVALSFRQTDAIDAETMILTDEFTAVADFPAPYCYLRQESLRLDVERMIKHGPLASGTVKEELSLASTSAGLLAWVPARRERGESVVDAAAGLSAARVRADAETVLRTAAEAEVDAKRAEVADLHAQVRALVSAVEASSAAIADVAAFRRETVTVLGARLSGAEAGREQLLREVEGLRADVEKKNAELSALAADRGRLQRVFRWR